METLSVYARSCGESSRVLSAWRKLSFERNGERFQRPRCQDSFHSFFKPVPVIPRERQVYNYDFSHMYDDPVEQREANDDLVGWQEANDDLVGRQEENDDLVGRQACNDDPVEYNEDNCNFLSPMTAASVMKEQRQKNQ